jgi:hypothetical protein
MESYRLLCSSGEDARSRSRAATVETELAEVRGKMAGYLKDLGVDV